MKVSDYQSQILELKDIILEGYELMYEYLSVSPREDIRSAVLCHSTCAPHSTNVYHFYLLTIMKPASPLLAIFAAISPSLAAPLSLEALRDRVDFDAPPGGDVAILNYALTLEYLERRFWQDGLARFSEEDFLKAGFWKGFYEQLREIYADEQVQKSTSPHGT